MKTLKYLAFCAISLSFVVSGMTGCGSDSPFTLIIDPAGPTVVMKGETLQFSVDPANTAVTWSVDGGIGNGSIDANGLYTPPVTLPIDPQITVRATDSLGVEGVSIVDLRTADTIAFEAPGQINDMVIPAATALEILLNGSGTRLSANLGSIQVDSVWSRIETAKGVAYYDSDLDFLGFGTDVNLFQDPANDYLSAGVTTNSQLNPGILATSNSTGVFRVLYLASQDQGDTFLAPVELDPSDPGDLQVSPKATLDGLDQVHAVYSHESTVLGTGSKVRYVRSADNGATWSAPVDVSAAASTQNFAAIAVGPDGQSIHVCYADDKGSAGATFDIFVVSSNDGGATFSAPVELSNSGTALFCQIALSPTGDLLVSYSDGANVLAAASTNQGASFGAPVTVNSAPTNVSLAFNYMAIDSLGRIDVVWNADVDNNSDQESLLYARSLDGGATYSAQTAIDGGVGETLILPMGLSHDESGRAHVQFLSNVNNPAVTDYDVFYSLAE